MHNNDAPAATRDQDEEGVRRTAKYRHAAVGYFIYGLIYFAGAVYLSTRGEGPGGGWIWFGVGAAMVVLFPVLIWKEMKWVARLLAFLVALRVFGVFRVFFDGSRLIEMPWGGEIPIAYGAAAFLTVAAIECYLLARAGWDI